MTVEGEGSMQVRILGPLEVVVEGRPLTIGGSKTRALLVLLALNANRVVSVDRLVDDLWGDERPDTSSAILQVRVSELRKAFRAAGQHDVVVTRAPGYELALGPGALDAAVFERLVADGRTRLAEGDPGAASLLFARALGLWRGPAGAELGDRATSRPEVVRLEEARLAAVEHRIEADLACGRHAAMVVELEALVTAQPLRERLWGQLMLALYRSGRQAESLRAYQAVRRILGEELGIEPGPELRALEQSILEQSTALHWESPPVAAGSPAGGPGPADLPTGVVTFLMTDIEGSTAMWEDNRQAMARSLARHDELVANAVAAGCGTLLKAKGEGDATLSVFQRASDAVNAALALQRALEGEAWPDGANLRVRMAIHTGEALERDGDYYGPTLNRAARLRGLAMGGQLLLSQVAAELVRDELPNSVQLVDLGQHALRDLSRAERIFALAPRDTAASPDPRSGTAGALPLPPPLAGNGLFVGRHEEMEFLNQVWKAAAAGERQACLVAGEPGIGKTTLAGAMARVAREAGATVLYGHCDEDLGVAYQPFVEALRDYVSSCPVEMLHAHVAAHGGDLARLVPELAHRVGIPAQVQSEPEAERLRLFEAAQGLLSEATRAAPVLLVLDDLHWAAKPTLLLLKHVLVHSSSSRLMVLCTYRDAELGRLHPLTAVLADLRRVEGVHRLAIAGLDREGVIEFVEAAASAAGATVDEDDGVAFGSALYTETEGNPFFVAEVLRHFGESRMAYRAGGRWRTDLSFEEFRIPEGVRDVIGRRLGRLSEPANRVLTLAAVVGREFDLGVLEHVPDVVGSPDELLDAIDEAVHAQVLTESPGRVDRFSFCHSLVRQALYQELTGARRARLHQRVAEAIEAAHAADLTPHLPALAHHYAETTRAGQAAKAADYALRAAESATDQLAFEEAIGYLERAVALLELDSHPDADHHFELLLALAASRERLFDYQGAAEAIGKAAGDARRLGSPELLARAASSGTPRRRFGSLTVDDEVLSLCEEALDGLGDADSALRAEVLAFLAAHRAFSGAGLQSEPLAREALAMARRVGDQATLGRALMALSWSLWGSERVTEQLALADELRELGQAAGNPMLELEGLLLRAPCRLMLGDVAGFDADADQLARGARRARWAYGLTHCALWEALRALLEGRFDEVEPLATAMLAQAGGDEDFIAAYGAQVIWLAFEQGRLEEIKPMVIATVEANLFVPVYRAALAFLHSALNELDEARAVFDALAPPDFAGMPRDLTWTASLALLSEVAVRLEDQEAAATLYQWLEPRAGQLLVVQGALCPGSADRYLGMLATVLDRHEQAEAHFAAAQALGARVGSSSLLARTDYWHAWHLARQGGAEALAHARRLLTDVEITAARLGMRALLDEARELDQRLDA